MYVTELSYNVFYSYKQPTLHAIINWWAMEESTTCVTLKVG